MKAVIPLAGKGTRLRPHTYLTPKPLIHVGGRPVMSYILDDLLKLGVDEMVFVVGYLGDHVRDYIAAEYPGIKAHYVEQAVQDGTAGAVRLAEPFIDEEVLILFVDTLFDADLSIATRLEESWSGVIWAKEVEDYHRFGVIVTDESGAMTRIIEKPSEPVSKLANIGLYYIRDHALLFEGIHHVMAQSPGPSGEFYLTDAFQYMVDKGARIRTAPVEGWYDCGKVDALLETNRHLLGTTRGGVDSQATVSTSEIDELVRVEAGCTVTDSTLGPNVTLESGASVSGSSLRDTIIGANAVIENAELHDSMIGEGATVRGVKASLNIAASSEALATER